MRRISEWGQTVGNLGLLFGAIAMASLAVHDTGGAEALSPSTAAALAFLLLVGLLGGALLSAYHHEDDGAAVGKRR